MYGYCHNGSIGIETTEHDKYNLPYHVNSKQCISETCHSGSTCCKETETWQDIIINLNNSSLAALVSLLYISTGSQEYTVHVAAATVLEARGIVPITSYLFYCSLNVRPHGPGAATGLNPFQRKLYTFFCHYLYSFIHSPISAIHRALISCLESLNDKKYYC